MNNEKRAFSRSFSRMFRPQSATARQESEMQDRSGRELQSVGISGDPIERLRLLCLSRGAHGILRLGRVLRVMDHDGSKHLTWEEFTTSLREVGLEISDEEAKDIFMHFDRNHSGSINIDDFLRNLRPPMSESRIKVFDDVFKKIDKDGDGELTLKNLRRVYNVNSNPRYISGEDSEESILKKFLDTFENKATRDGKVTKEEFLNYYSAVSASIDNDCYFDLMMRQSYKL